MPSIVNVANMCAHLQNVSRAQLALTSIKNTKYNMFLALALHRAGFVSHVYRAGPHPPTLEQMVSETPEPVTNLNVATRRIWVGMKYQDGSPVLKQLNVISKPKRLITADIKSLGKLTRGFPAKVKGGVVQGLGLGECMFLATSLGMLEAREALARKTGGLLICRAS